MNPEKGRLPEDASRLSSDQEGQKPDETSLTAEHASAQSQGHDQQDPDSNPERQKEIREFLDARLEFAIKRYAERINEGNNGIIMRMNLAEVPDDLKNDLKRMGMDTTDEAAVAKILKIYNPGLAEKEFSNQMRAYEIASSGAGDGSYARVPKPHFFRDIEIDDEVRRKLASRSSGFRASEKIEVITMDHIPGEDLSTLLFKEVLRRHPRATHLRDHVDSMGFEDLHEEVRNALSFERPGGKARDEGERIHEEMKVQAMNKDRIFDFLLKDGAQVNPVVVEQIANTIDLMHENGFTIRDGHHRNFMIVGDLFVRPGAEGQDEPRTYIIDFENSVSFEPGLNEDDIRERFLRVAEKEGKNFHDPRVPLRDIERLVSSAEERAEEREMGPARKTAGEISGLRNTLERRLEKRSDPGLESFEKGLSALLSTDSESGLEDIARLYMTHPLKTQRRIDGLLVSIDRLIDRGKVDPERMNEALITLKESLPTNEKNVVVNYLRSKKSA